MKLSPHVVAAFAFLAGLAVALGTGPHVASPGGAAASFCGLGYALACWFAEDA